MLRPSPTIGGIDDVAFWEGCRRGELLVQRSPVSGKFVWPIVPVSPEDLQTPMEWVRVSGRGTVSHYAVYNRAYDPLFEGKIPYVVAGIDLEEGVRMTGNLFAPDGSWDATAVFGGKQPDNSLVGRAVTVFFEDAGNDISIPQWKLIPQ